MSSESIGDRIRARRIALGMTQHDLGEAVGVRAQQVWRWEKDRRVPRRDKIDLLASVLRTSSKVLLFGSTDGRMEHGARRDIESLETFVRLHPDIEEWEARALRASAAWVAEPSDPDKYFSLLAALRFLGQPDS